jgi:hypothetical protein
MTSRKGRGWSCLAGVKAWRGDYDNDGFEDLFITYWGTTFSIATTATAL